MSAGDVDIDHGIFGGVRLINAHHAEVGIGILKSSGEENETTAGNIHGRLAVNRIAVGNIAVTDADRLPVAARDAERKGRRRKLP